MKKNICILCIASAIWLFGFSVYAQEGTSRQPSDTETDTVQRLMLARSSAEYRVTPGDVYTLVYAAGTSPVTYTISVDSSYRIRVSNLGIVNGAGKTFMQLKSEVENVVANNYPLSGVQLVLTQPAAFRVYLKGEVYTAGEIPAWALSRLSSLVNFSLQAQTRTQINLYTRQQSPDDILTSLASIRDVSIQSANGQVRVYDLFKARRTGDLSQDPYLRPGDVITFNRIKRVVSIDGAVERPGVYQLMDGENIQELIESYGGGFTPVADKSRLEMVRLINSEDIAGDKIFLTEEDLANDYTLENFDTVAVPSITQLLAVMFMEGAVQRPLADSAGATTELAASNRIVIQFYKGDTYASLVRTNVHLFSAVSDTMNSYIVREGQNIPINLNPMLYDASYRDEVFVQENDILIVPFRQYFVTVAGAVAVPGRYPHIPDRDWEYYIAAAGGFVAGRNARETIIITDITGKRLKKTDAIVPETVITASTNHFLYGFNQVAPIITTLLSIVSTFLSIFIAAGRI